eukprot:3014170-Pleurochrysis_carterae.AAC.1
MNSRTHAAKVGACGTHIRACTFAQTRTQAHKVSRLSTHMCTCSRGRLCACALVCIRACRCGHACAGAGAGSYNHAQHARLHARGPRVDGCAYARLNVRNGAALSLCVCLCVLSLSDDDLVHDFDPVPGVRFGAILQI